ncbi:pilus assembly protein PilG [Aggregicoccus sp. 17bor-14]|uniref:pilus assembly protein PilG n=1 Tax=Myxococcaceae TaxID=31 RepID=UPI00129CCF70|nr:MULTISPECIES: pilus assembly protein PilG [Myxococcaceae]MBF5044739.1 pilus assembly protein PilG [Simulacricoccus sp. 17bor-14]MRI90484.1 pilus assembly protein PilG [Aggregicoccus sp. 17bor-14]
MPLPSWVVLAGSLLSLLLLSAPPERARPGRDRPMLPRVDFLHAVGAAHQHLIADYYWLLTINQIGRAQTAADYRDIYPYADLVTDLDPKFVRVYSFAGVAIPFDKGRQNFVNTDESTRLLRKGARNVPGDYQIEFTLAHNLIFFDHQYRAAADILHRLSQSPFAPPFVSALATRLYAQSGNFDAGLALAAYLRDTAAEPETREFFEHRVLEIQQEQVLQGLDREVARFRDREGRLPRTPAELVERGQLQALPADPLGGDFYVDAEGRSHSTAAKARLELHEDENLRAPPKTASEQAPQN